MLNTPAQRLNHVRSVELITAPPFHFLFSVWKPSHFPTALERHFGDVSYRTFRLKNGMPVAAKLSALVDDRAGLVVRLYSSRELKEVEVDELRARVRIAYGLDFPIAEFYDAVASDQKLVEGPIKNLYGMRPSCPETMFEILVISIILQNTTVKRSEQMFSSLLERFGDRVEVDGQELFTFCDVHRLAASSESELREQCRLGYRAKFLQPIAEAFATNTINDDGIRQLPEDEAKAELMKAKGVGPYTAHTVLSSSMQSTSLINLDVWNRKILSNFLFDRDDASPEVVLQEAARRWKGYQALAALYIIEDLAREAPAGPLVVVQ